MSPNTKTRWAGRILSALPVLFLLFDASVKFTTLPVVVDAQQQLGYPMSLAPIIAAIELACVALYLIPRTSIFGAVLLTGYFGGAIASHVRVGNPLFSHVLFPTYVAALVWGGLYLRDRRLRAVITSAADV